MSFPESSLLHRKKRTLGTLEGIAGVVRGFAVGQRVWVEAALQRLGVKPRAVVLR